MITVLRLSHRPFRDQRITTHCALISRAFGADNLIYSGEKDSKFEESVSKVVDNWGGKFKVEFNKNPRRLIKNFKKKGKVVHLTMYGLEFEKKLRALKKERNLLIIVGSEKVPGEIYELADYNIAVGNTPHSEMGALAVILYKLNGIKKFKDGKVKITPNERGKTVEKG